MAELDTYAIPQAHDPAFASGFGDLSVHEVATSQLNANVAYFSYYSGGFRVAEIQGTGTDAELVETGHFIDVDGSNFWGVEVFSTTARNTSPPAIATTALHLQIRTRSALSTRD